MLRILGYVPRGHSIRELLGLLVKALEGLGRVYKVNDVKAILLSARDELRLVEEAYTASRYTGRMYTVDDTRGAVDSLKNT